METEKLSQGITRKPKVDHFFNHFIIPVTEVESVVRVQLSVVQLFKDQFVDPSDLFN